AVSFSRPHSSIPCFRLQQPTISYWFLHFPAHHFGCSDLHSHMYAVSLAHASRFYGSLHAPAVHVMHMTPTPVAQPHHRLRLHLPDQISGSNVAPTWSLRSPAIWLSTFIVLALVLSYFGISRDSDYK